MNPSAQPIVFNSNPVADQVAAGLRYGLLTVSAIGSALGYTHFAGQASALLMAVGPASVFAVFLWGQFSTRRMSKNAAAAAAAAPNTVAMTSDQAAAVAAMGKPL